MAPPITELRSYVGRRLLTLLVAFALVGGGVVGSPRVASAEPLAGPSRYVSLDPTRVLDTRTLGPALAAGGSLDLVVAGRNGVPADATAVVLNVTIDQATGPGYVQVLPTGQAEIGASSNLNVTEAGQTIANAVVVPVGDGGQVTLYASGGGHLVVDVFGAFVPAPGAVAGGRFVPITPRRAWDSRAIKTPNPGDVRDCPDFGSWEQANTYYWFYLPWNGDVANLDPDGDGIPCNDLWEAAGRPTPGRPRALTSHGPNHTFGLRFGTLGDLPWPGTRALVLNVTMVDADAGFVQVLPRGSTATGRYSNVNASVDGQTISNLAIVPLGTDATIDFYIQPRMHLVVDVMGYITDDTAAPSTDGRFVPVRPGRLVDTRNTTRLGQGGSLDLQVRGAAGVPATGVSAVMANLTAVDASAPGFLQMYPTGLSQPGAHSNVNVMTAGQTIPNAAVSPLSPEGAVTVYSHQGADVLVDIFGYFTGP